MSQQTNSAESKDPTTAPVTSKTAPTDKPQEENGNAPNGLPQSAHNGWNPIAHGMKRLRNAAIMATPAPIVNNSSNVLSTAHVATEVLMFKSGMPGNKLIDDPSKPINWVVQPAQKILKDIFGIGKPSSSKITDIFRRNPIESFKRFRDLHGASMREVEHQIDNKALAAAGKQAEELKLGNSWQARTTGTGLAIFTLGALIPEKKESDDEIERMAKMRTLNPLHYILERYKQAVWAPDWSHHKRQMLGLGFNLIGMFSMLGAWRNRADLVPELKITKHTPKAEVEAKLQGHIKSIRAAEKEGQVIAKSVLKNAALIERALEKGYHLTQGYKFNRGYFWTGLISFIQGMPLLFALDEDRAYSLYGTATFVRTPSLIKSIGEKYRGNEDGWIYYMTAKLSFAVEDVLFMLIGGAEKKKNPDGSITIVDHTELKKKAIAEAKAEKEKLKARERLMYEREDKSLIPKNSDMIPVSKIAKVASHEAAMPERVAQVAEQKEAAAVTA